MENRIPEIAILGAGHRGLDTYGRYIKENPQEGRVSAIIETDPVRRLAAIQSLGLNPAYAFATLDLFLAGPKIADSVIVATPDRTHSDSAVRLLEGGYSILLEKPIGSDIDSTMKVWKAQQETALSVDVCHVLRYTDFFLEIKKVLESGAIGEITNVDYREDISYWHMAHSYVRGNWNQEETSGPLILTKCSHDLDILIWLIGERPLQVSSFANLGFFTENKKPSPAPPERCSTDCKHEKECIYSALEIYDRKKPMQNWIDSDKENVSELWPFRVVSKSKDRETFLLDLWNGPYSKCVFQGINTVVDRQVANIEFESGCLVAFSVHGFSNEDCRTFRIFGTKGDIEGKFGYSGPFYRVHTKKGNWSEEKKFPSFYSGHGGGDSGLMKRYLAKVQAGNNSELASLEFTIYSHLLGFAIEQSRKENRVVGVPSL